jgi:hypothetical protein
VELEEDGIKNWFQQFFQESSGDMSVEETLDVVSSTTGICSERVNPLDHPDDHTFHDSMWVVGARSKVQVEVHTLFEESGVDSSIPNLEGDVEGVDRVCWFLDVPNKDTEFVHLVFELVPGSYTGRDPCPVPNTKSIIDMTPQMQKVSCEFVGDCVFMCGKLYGCPHASRGCSHCCAVLLILECI